MSSNNNDNIDDILKAATPLVLALTGGAIAITALLASRDLTVSIAGLGAATGFATGASGLARSPEKKQGGVGEITNAENVEVKN